MTLLQLAQRLNVAESTVQRYESGNIKNLKYETIVELAAILECTPASLMGWSEFIRCPKCGFTYDKNSLAEIKDHEQEHARWASAAHKFAPYYIDDESRDQIKTENRNKRNNPASTLEERYAAEILVMQCLFSRSVDQCRPIYRHVDFPEYVSMLLGQKGRKAYSKHLDRALFEKLVDEYGQSDGILAGETSYTPPAGVALATDEAQLLQNYQKLNQTGKDKARDYVSDLTEQKKYIANPVVTAFHDATLLEAAHATTDDLDALREDFKAVKEEWKE